ncbi:MAG: sulfatase [Planctomycetota bacterium]
MNIIVIVADTLRQDYLGCYGNDWVRTPCLDAFAKRAAVFNRAYAGSFPTIPMRADLMTGRYVFHSYGWAPMPPGETAIAEILRKDGYLTALFSDHLQLIAPGMNYHKGFGHVNWTRGQVPDVIVTDPIEVKLPCKPEKMRNPAGCAQYLKNKTIRRYERDEYVAVTMQNAADWLERNYRHDKMFMYIDTFQTHEPWLPPQWYSDIYDPGYEGEEVIWPRYDWTDYLTEAELKHAVALYAGTVTLVDRWVGMFLQKVQDLGLMDDTAILFTADHGFLLGEQGRIGKHTVLKPKEGWPLYEEIARIPLLVWMPEIKERRDLDALVQPVDMMASMLDMAGVDIPGNLHGRSFLPVIRGNESSVRECAVSSGSITGDPSFICYSGITDGEWSYHCGGENGETQLYHLPSDPQQQKNVLGKNQAIAKRLHAWYIDLLKSIGASEELIALRAKC